jgi:hypothetical protein
MSDLATRLCDAAGRGDVDALQALLGTGDVTEWVNCTPSMLPSTIALNALCCRFMTWPLLGRRLGVSVLAGDTSPAKRTTLSSRWRPTSRDSLCFLSRLPRGSDAVSAGLSGSASPGSVGDRDDAVRRLPSSSADSLSVSDMTRHRRQRSRLPASGEKELVRSN